MLVSVVHKKLSIWPGATQNPHIPVLFRLWPEVFGASSVSYLWLLSLLEESLLAGLLLGLLANEVLGLGDLVDLLGVDAREVDLLRCSDDVSGVDSSQGDTVDLEGAGDEQDTLVEGLQEDDTLAAEAAGEQDQDGAGLQGLARLPGANGLADLCCESNVSLPCPLSRCLYSSKCPVIPLARMSTSWT